MAMKPLVTPVVNLNGSPSANLIRDRMEVCNHLRAAFDAMANAAPHGRDYQHLIRVGDWSEHHAAVKAAQDAWRERMAMLETIRSELEADAIAIMEQGR
jgi:hypothetical protein